MRRFVVELNLRRAPALALFPGCVLAATRVTGCTWRESTISSGLSLVATFLVVVVQVHREPPRG